MRLRLKDVGLSVLSTLLGTVMALVIAFILLTLPVKVEASEYQDITIETLGWTDQEAMTASGVPQWLQYEDNSCSNRHDKGDVSNQWCHITISKAAHGILLEKGFSNWQAHLGGVLIFLAKELGDKNYDWSDVNSAPITFKVFNEDTEITLVVKGDLSFWVQYSVDF